jgi:hypothetical protein
VESSGGVFYRTQVEGPSDTVMVGVMVRSLPQPMASIGGVFEYMRKMSDSRFMRMSLTDRWGPKVIEYETLTRDDAASAGPRDRFVRTKGVIVLHPESAYYALDIGYSRRSEMGEIGEEYERRGTEFVEKHLALYQRTGGEGGESRPPVPPATAGPKVMASARRSPPSPAAALPAATPAPAPASKPGGLQPVRPASSPPSAAPLPVATKPSPSASPAPAAASPLGKPAAPTPMPARIAATPAAPPASKPVSAPDTRTATPASSGAAQPAATNVSPAKVTAPVARRPWKGRGSEDWPLSGLFWGDFGP